MTAERKELTPAQVRDIAQALGVESDERVWVLAIDVQEGVGTTDVLASDDVAWFTGQQMELGSRSQYANGTFQMTFKRKPTL